MPKSKCLVFLSGLILFMALQLSADVMIENKTSVSIGGGGDILIDSEQYFTEDKMYSKGLSQVNGFMGMDVEFTEFNIIRLDKKLEWNYSKDDSTYTEKPLEFIDIKNNGNRMQSAFKDYKWSDPAETELEPKTIAGIEASGVGFRTVGVKTDNPSDSTFLVYRHYYADNFEGSETLVAFQNKMKEITGFDFNLMLLMDQESEDEMLFAPVLGFIDRLSEIKGFPLRIEVVVTGNTDPLQALIDKGEIDPETLKVMEEMGMAPNRHEQDAEGHFIFISMSDEVISIKKQSVDRSRFDLPPGLTKTSEEYYED